jgi:ABC-2 type transport system ATP-binding protein
MANDSDAVLLEQITKRYDGLTAVDQLSLHIKRGSLFGLLGPNGAGKTTTLRMLMRILVPDEGRVEILGEAQSDRTQDLIGYLPEERGLYVKMEVLQVLVFLGALKGLSEAEAKKRSQEWLGKLGLEEWAKKKVTDLSKGMQQKVQFIAAVLSRPPVLILDEPFTGLDPMNAALLKDMMLDMRHEGATLILSTHRMEQVEMMCDSICLIDKGRNILSGELKAIKRAHGKNTLRIEYEGDGSFLDLPDQIEKVTHYGALVEAKLRPGADSQMILRAAVERGVRITRFELVEPPLNEIFIEEVSRTNA